MGKTQPRILLVEDEMTMARYIKELLAITSEERPSLTIVETLAQCIDVLGADNGIDLVLLDLNLPDSTGFKTFEKVSGLFPDTAIVILTGMDDQAMGVKAIQAGAQDYLCKGAIDSRGLLLSLRYALERIHYIKEIKRQNDKLRRARQELEEAYSRLKETQLKILHQEKMVSIGQLAAGVAHEINNPMGFITSNLNTLQRYLERVRYFHTMTVEESPALRQRSAELKMDFILDDSVNLIGESLEGADRVRSIILELRNFSRVEQEERKPADINHILEGTINIAWNELKYGVTLNKEYGELPSISCYPRQLSQVFMNLLINAAQSMDTRGEITIKTWLEKDSLFIAIHDTGCGIPRDNLSRVFEPFFTTKEVGKGTGLGLSIAYDIVVKNHGGEISVESEIGKGTVFTVQLPRSVKTSEEEDLHDGTGNHSLC